MQYNWIKIYYLLLISNKSYKILLKAIQQKIATIYIPKTTNLQLNTEKIPRKLVCPIKQLVH